jgi:hypothetical protein
MAALVALVKGVLLALDSVVVVEFVGTLEDVGVVGSYKPVLGLTKDPPLPCSPGT